MSASTSPCTEPPPACPLIDPDHTILGFAAAHHLVVQDQVQALLPPNEKTTEKTARLALERLAALTQNGLLNHHRCFHGLPGSYQITCRGLEAIGSDLPAPRFETLRPHRHDIGVGWISLHAYAGTFGPTARILTEREMRFHDINNTAAQQANDASKRPAAQPGDRQTIYGVHPRDQGHRPFHALHYRDVMLIRPEGRIAIELKTFIPARKPLDAIITGYGADPNIKTVLYLAGDDTVTRTIQTAAAALRYSALITVQPSNSAATPDQPSRNSTATAQQAR